MPVVPPAFPVLSPAALPASPRRRWWQAGPWQPSAGQYAAARQLALEAGSALTFRLDDAAYVTRRAVPLGNWLTGAVTEADMAARYGAVRQALINYRRAGCTPEPAAFIEAAAAYARFLTGG